MSRSRILLVSLGASCLAAGVASGLLSGSPALATPDGHEAGARSAVAAVLVTAGKPTEFAFTLSKREVSAGLVTFKVTNRGKVVHTFKVCASTTARTSTACVGVVTKPILPGKSQTLVVKLKKGVHEFLCTISTHAKLGMRGLLGIAVKPPAQTTTTHTTTSSTTTTQTTTTRPTTTAPPPDECPPGQTIVANGAGDQDDDDTGGPTDGDGCL